MRRATAAALALGATAVVLGLGFVTAASYLPPGVSMTIGGLIAPSLAIISIALVADGTWLGRRRFHGTIATASILSLTIMALPQLGGAWRWFAPDYAIDFPAYVAALIVLAPTASAVTYVLARDNTQEGAAPVLRALVASVALVLFCGFLYLGALVFLPLVATAAAVRRAVVELRAAVQPSAASSFSVSSAVSK